MNDVSDATGSRVRALRERLGLSQEKLAAAAQLSRVEVVKAESGANKMTSFRMRTGFARAFGMSVEQFEAFICGELDVEGALGIAREPKTGTEG